MAHRDDDPAIPELDPVGGADATTFLRMTFATIPDGLAAFDRDFRLAFWNDRYFELMGYPRTLAVRGTHFEAFIGYNAREGEYGAGDPDRLVRERMRPDLLAMHRDLEWPRSSGHVVRLRRSPVPGGGLLVVVSDVTEVKRQELRNRHSELRLELLSESVDEGLLIHDGQKVVDANAAALRMLRATRDQLVGRLLEVVFPGPTWTTVSALIAGGGESSAEVQGRRLDGAPFPLELLNRTVPPSHEQLYEPLLLQPDGRLVQLRHAPSDREAEQAPGHVLLPEGRLVMMTPAERDAEIARQSTRMLLMRDLTERQEAERERERVEEQLRQSQKLEALGTLAGGIAHDFNNILSSVLGNAHLLLETAAEGEVAHRYGQRILTAGNRARELVNRMLAVARQSPAERRPVDVESLVVEAMVLIRASLPATIEIRGDTRSALPYVYADPLQIHQVLMNLCANAGHAMPDGGELIITLEAVEVGEPLTFRESRADPGSYVRVSVVDSGHGIAPDLLDRIFDPFFTTKRVGEGTGLGLSVVRGIVTGHDGAIEVTSTPGQGTTVHVYLPRASDAQACDAPQPAHRPTGKGEVVLVVDDEPALLEILEEMLEILGYEPISAASGDAAFSALRASPARFDLVLTDLTMHGMTGLVLAREAKALRPDLPVVLATGYSDAGARGSAHAHAVDRVLNKPVSLDDLALCLDGLLRGGRS